MITIALAEHPEREACGSTLEHTITCTKPRGHERPHSHVSGEGHAHWADDDPRCRSVEHPETGERDHKNEHAVVHRDSPPKPDRCILCDKEGVALHMEPCLIASREPLQDGGERLKNLRPEDRALCEIIDDVHERNVGGQHQSGFCESCANFYTVASRAIALRHPHQDVEAARQVMRTILRGVTLSDHEWLAIDNLLDRFAPSPDDRGGER